MTKLEKFLRGDDTPMDAAERAAIRKLIEVDCSGGIEFDSYNPSISPSGFPKIGSPPPLGSQRKNVWLIGRNEQTKVGI